MTEINEIEILRRQFLMFFKNKTDNQFRYIKAKHDNIYNMESVNKSSYKQLIISKLLSYKVVMLHEESYAKNFINR